MGKRLIRLLPWVILLIVLAVPAAFAWGEYCLSSARKELDGHRAARGRRWLERGASLTLRRSEYHLLCGRAARMLEEFDAAEQHLLECQRREGEPGEESTLEWAMLRAQRGDVDPVEEFLRKKVDHKHPQSTLILEAMAAGYLQLYRVFDAFNCLRQWSERGPEPARALV